MGKTNDESAKGGNFKVERNSLRQNGPGNRCVMSGIPGLGDVVETVIASGAYLSFGATFDGGAILIRVLDGPEKLSTYCHTREELEEAIQALRDRYKDDYLRVVSGAPLKP